MNEEYMKKAIELSRTNEKNNFNDGGPFGAIIVKDDIVISEACNSVLSSKDPTAHAEVNAIRKACENLNTHDLEGCTLYTSCYPCPMCLSAIIWSNINKIYYGCTKEDADNIGFRDDRIYSYINNKEGSILELNELQREEALKVFEKYEETSEKGIY